LAVVAATTYFKNTSGPPDSAEAVTQIAMTRIHPVFRANVLRGFGNEGRRTFLTGGCPRPAGVSPKAFTGEQRR